jgi:hypothetical protein
MGVREEDPDRSPQADPVAESLRLLACASDAGLTVRVLGGVAVRLQAPDRKPLLSRVVRDIDLVTERGGGRAASELLQGMGYVGDEMFNALHGARRLLYHDPRNDRDIDVFVGQFSMCHEIPIADRLGRHPLTVPLAELLLTKLQIVELTDRDQRDIYSLLFHAQVNGGGESGIEPSYIAHLCGRDWGLWRTSMGNIELSRTNLDSYGLTAEQRGLIDARLEDLRNSIDSGPKTGKWRMRSRVGDRVRWYQQPEEERHGD